jgi:predicted nucleic acid-binding protein
LSGIVLDASVTLAWCFVDEQSTYSLTVLERLQTGDHAVVPAFWSVEVLNTLLVGEKRRRITAEQTQMFLRDLRALAPVIDYASLDSVIGIVQTISRDHRLTPYDALYVELALRLGYPLATLDQAQRDAARSLGVALFLNK